MILAMAASLALAQEPSVFIDDGVVSTVVGPVHVVPKERMDVLLGMVQDAQDFERLLGEALAEKDALIAAKSELELALEDHRSDTEAIAERDAQLERYDLKLRRRTNERNIAIAVAGTTVAIVATGSAIAYAR